MNKSESIKNLAIALSKFQGEVENPTNTAENPFFKSKYAPLEEVLNTVRPILSKHGLSIVQAPSTEENNITISTTLVHESGEYMEFPKLSLKMDKVTAQGAGSAITYARRYAISAILGISSEDDDDGNQAEKDSKGQRNNNSNLSDAQIKRLYAIGFSRGISKDTINRSIKQDYKKNNPANLTKKEYDELCNRLEKQPKKE